MAETRWTHARGWLIASALSNLAASVLGLSTDWTGEPAWLRVVQALLVAVAFISIVVFFVKIARWRVPDTGAERTSQ